MIFTILYFYQFLVILLNSISDIFKHKISFKLYIQRFFNLNLKKSDILLHACSCGESKLLNPILNILTEKNISYQLSIHTPSGYNIMKNNKNIFLKPYDNFLLMFYVFYVIRPKILIISSRDVWPFFIFWALYFDVKIIFVNYEIKGSSIKNMIYYGISNKIFLKNKLKTDLVKYNYLGNLKFLSCKNNCQKKGLLKIVIASVNEDEFDIHLNFMIELLIIFPKIKFIYVPRQLNWLNKLKNKLKNINYTIKFDSNLNLDNIEPNIIIFWKYGLLEEIYSYTNICIMGDTFNNVGGHNLIEPAINENFIITGPNISTCEDLYNILEGKIKVSNLTELINCTIKIIKNHLYLKYGKKNKNKILNIQKNIQKNLKENIYKLLN